MRSGGDARRRFRPGYHAGRPLRNKGMHYPADPPTVEEVVAVMRQTADDRHGWRVRAMIVVLWRSGLRIQEELALGEHDVDHRRGSARPQRQGRAPTRGRHGRVVPGAAPTVAARTGRAAGRAADSASSTGPPTAGPGQASAPAANPHDRASSGADVGATRAPTLAPAREVELIADAGAPPESDPGPACGSPEDRIDVEGQVVRILSEPVCLG